MPLIVHSSMQHTCTHAQTHTHTHQKFLLIDSLHVRTLSLCLQSADLSPCIESHVFVLPDRGYDLKVLFFCIPCLVKETGSEVAQIPQLHPKQLYTDKISKDSCNCQKLQTMWHYHIIEQVKAPWF